MTNEIVLYQPNEQMSLEVKLGKKWFAFNRMEMPTTELLQKIQTTYKTPPS